MSFTKIVNPFYQILMLLLGLFKSYVIELTGYGTK